MPLSTPCSSPPCRNVAFVLSALLLAGCADGDPLSGADPSDDEATPLAGALGCDYSFARPSPAHLAGEGYKFAARYLSYDAGKNLSASEATALANAGLAIVSNWEVGADDALDGFDRGAQHARDGQAQAAAAGAPPDRPIYFSVDFDASEGQQAAINAYMDGAASVIGRARVGAYGGYYVVKRLFDAGKITFGWQTFAWSGGQWDARAQIRQVQNGLEGGAIDKDQAMVDDIGQWGTGSPPGGTPPPASSQAPEGSQAFLVPNQQHYVNRDASGNVRHHWWDARTTRLTSDTWGTGVAGQPVSFVDGTSQHVFARGTDGGLKHWYWDPVNGSGHDDWAPSGGLAGDPAAIMIGDYQDVWAVDGSTRLQHWYWGPHTNGTQHDTWGSGVTGRPTAFATASGEQHVFARGTGGTLEHWWWAAGVGISHDTWGTGLGGDPTALAIGEFQDVWAVDTVGQLSHWYWGPHTNGVKTDTWGSGVAGRPSVVVYTNGDQEVFARGTGGTLEHFWWNAELGVSHDTWGSGITRDPTAEIIAAQQHVWALDAADHAQHWFWDPATNSIHHDDWGK